jgi:DNA-binding NtrC family response regulator
MEEISEGLHYKLAVVDLSYERSQLYGIHVFNESKRVNPKVPVIIMTGYGNKSLALAWALNGIITKPLDTREFAAFISRRLEIVAQR